MRGPGGRDRVERKRLRVKWRMGPQQPEGGKVLGRSLRRCKMRCKKTLRCKKRP